MQIKRWKTIVLTLVLALSVSYSSEAQEADDARFDFFGGLQLDSTIPAPFDFLGYEAGLEYTPHHRVEDYIHAVADASDRVSIHEYGRTYEDRGLYYLVITSPENHSRIEDIRKANLRMASGDPDAGMVQSTSDGGQPVVTWLSYNVHGNEASSTEAAMNVLYRLAAATDAGTEEILRRSVVIIDPSINPDGRDRYVNWYRSTQSHIRNSNANDYEHTEPWPGGRTNHYWFDLNRDWIWLVHPESRGRLEAYNHWLPQVHIDYHEQGYNSNYFTMPGQTPRNLNLPVTYESWSEIFGRASAAALDANQVNYFTREAFDFFYPGYGSSYPSNLGAIGMLAEQGGGSRGGRAVTTDDGYVLTLKQRVFDHYATSMAVIETAVANRTALFQYFVDFFQPESVESATKAYFLNDDGGSGYTYDVVAMLMKHGIEVERAKKRFSVNRAFDYLEGTAAKTQFDEGTFVIRTNQPRHILINTLMQRQMVIEDSVMYDMASWSAPLAYGLDASWTETAFSAELEPVTEPPTYDAGVENPQASYAFVVDWSQRAAPNALSALWKAGYRVRFAKKTFTMGEASFSRGSLIVLLGRNQSKIDGIQADMTRIATENHVRIHGFNTGRVDSGIDLASTDSRPIDMPRVGLVVGSGMNSYTAGQIWFLFDRWTSLSIDRIDISTLRGVKLDAFDVFIFPGGNLETALDSTQMDRLKAWVSAGGTLIATESSASYLTESKSGFTSAELVSIQDSTDGEPEEIPSRFFTSYEAREDSTGLTRIPGSALRTIVDETHPLAFGLGKDLYTLKFGTDALKPSESLQTVGRYFPDPEKLLVSGYASQKNREKLAGNTFAGVIPMAAGRVVLLLDNTQYRMFWVGPARMIQNAVMLVPGM